MVEEAGGKIARSETGFGGDIGGCQDPVVVEGEEGERQEAGGRVQGPPAALHLLCVGQPVERL